MLWEMCIPKEPFDFVSQKQNFEQLYTLAFKYADTNEIIDQFIQNDPKIIGRFSSFFKKITP